MAFRPVEVELLTFGEIAEWQSQPRYRIGILGGFGEFGRNCAVIEDASAAWAAGIRPRRGRILRPDWRLANAWLTRGRPNFISPERI
jgi:hypothetical protein